MKSYPFSLVYLIPLSVIIGYLFGNFFTYLTPILVFVIVPILDVITGKNTKNPDVKKVEKLKKKKSFRVWTWISVPFNFGIVIWGLFILSTDFLNLIEFFGFTLSIGINSGITGINISHELQHRVRNKYEPFIARIILLSTLYMHWAIEHVTGHHRWVATPKDPATAKLNQSFYAFWFQSIFRGFLSAWKFEKQKNDRMGKKGGLLRNRVFQYLLIEIIFVVLIYLYFGLLAMVFFFLQAFIAISLLEAVNYIEHYGLLRKKDGSRYEKVKPIHSWNSSERLTNYFLFNLQRHSDHHYKPSRRYQILKHHEEAPQLPTGYAGMILISLIPPLFKSMVHKLIPQKIYVQSSKN